MRAYNQKTMNIANLTFIVIALASLFVMTWIPQHTWSKAADLTLEDGTHLHGRFRHDIRDNLLIQTNNSTWLIPKGRKVVIVFSKPGH